MMCTKHVNTRVRRCLHTRTSTQQGTHLVEDCFLQGIPRTFPIRDAKPLQDIRHHALGLRGQGVRIRVDALQQASHRSLRGSLEDARHLLQARQRHRWYLWGNVTARRGRGGEERRHGQDGDRGEEAVLS